MPNNLGDWIRAALRQLGKNQSWLADQVGVEPPQISRLISGQTEATPSMLNKLADALHKPRVQAYIAAGHLSEKEAGEDPWVEEKRFQLSRLRDPRLRHLADNLIQGLAEQQEQEEREQTRTRGKTRPA